MSFSDCAHSVCHDSMHLQRLVSDISYPMCSEVYIYVLYSIINLTLCVVRYTSFSL